MLAQLTESDYNKILYELAKDNIVRYAIFTGKDLGSTAYKKIGSDENILIFGALHIFSSVGGIYTGYVHSGIRVNRLRTIIRERSNDIIAANPVIIANTIKECIYGTLEVM